LSAGTNIGPGEGAVPGSRLRKRRRQRGVEGHVALDLLGQLMNVPVQNGDRTEALEQSERLRTILGCPQPHSL